MCLDFEGRDSGHPVNVASSYNHLVMDAPRHQVLWRVLFIYKMMPSSLKVLHALVALDEILGANVSMPHQFADHYYIEWFVRLV